MPAFELRLARGSGASRASLPLHLTVPKADSDDKSAGVGKQGTKQPKAAVVGRRILRSRDPRISRTGQLRFVEQLEGEERPALRVELMGKNSASAVCFCGPGRPRVKRISGKNAAAEGEKGSGEPVTLHAGDEVSFVGATTTYTLRVKRFIAPERRRNYRFYRNDLVSSPDGGLIDDLHAQWEGNFDLLEAHHGYIQWLFPMYEGQGMNYQSKELYKDEAALMRSDPAVAERIVRSYRLMLCFFGLVLEDDTAGTIGRANDFAERFQNIEDHPHNLLRITRIVTSLGQLGFASWRAPLVERFRAEIEDHGNLPGARGSLDRFWKPLADETQWDTLTYVERTEEDGEEDRGRSVWFDRAG
jgi:Opioid growth factor receptor (OGFr) conserved region